MRVSTSFQTDNHASTPPLSFLQAGCPSCHPTNSIKALKANFLWQKPNKISSLCIQIQTHLRTVCIKWTAVKLLKIILCFWRDLLHLNEAELHLTSTGAYTLVNRTSESSNLGHVRPESLQRSPGLQCLFQCGESGGDAARFRRRTVMLPAAEEDAVHKLSRMLHELSRTTELRLCTGHHQQSQVSVAEWLVHLTAVWEDPGSNHATDSCDYSDSCCDIQSWARAVHLYCR